MSYKFKFQALKGHVYNIKLNYRCKEGTDGPGFSCGNNSDLQLKDISDIFPRGVSGGIPTEGKVDISKPYKLVVSGNTYQFKDNLKSEGFSYNPNNKTWEKSVTPPDKPNPYGGTVEENQKSALASIIVSAGKGKHADRSLKGELKQLSNNIIEKASAPITIKKLDKNPILKVSDTSSATTSPVIIPDKGLRPLSSSHGDVSNPIKNMPGGVFNPELTNKLYTISENIQNGKITIDSLKNTHDLLLEQEKELKDQIQKSNNIELKNKFNNIHDNRLAIATAITDFDKINLFREKQEILSEHPDYHKVGIPVEKVQHLQVDGFAGKSKMVAKPDDDGEIVYQPENYNIGQTYDIDLVKISNGYVAYDRGETNAIYKYYESPGSRDGDKLPWDRLNKDIKIIYPPNSDVAIGKTPEKAIRNLGKNFKYINKSNIKEI